MSPAARAAYAAAHILRVAELVKASRSIGRITLGQNETRSARPRAANAEESRGLVSVAVWVVLVRPERLHFFDVSL
jgi:hypothetical protein